MLDGAGTNFRAEAEVFAGEDDALVVTHAEMKVAGVLLRVLMEELVMMRTNLEALGLSDMDIVVSLFLVILYLHCSYCSVSFVSFFPTSHVIFMPLKYSNLFFVVMKLFRKNRPICLWFRLLILCPVKITQRLLR